MVKSNSVFVIVCLLLVFNGCADLSKKDENNISLEKEQSYWWYANFKINWPEGTDPDLYIDTLLADQVVEPVLITEKNNIQYWRFHRRAARDEAGHQFSFIFYSDKKTARSIYKILRNKSITKLLISEKILLSLDTDNLDNNTRSDISATSDKTWSKEMQVAWPDYIMGVSQLWLNLINEYATDVSKNNIPEMMEAYKQIDMKITNTWQTEGKQALLHHLNAIFGYQPLMLDLPTRF